MNKYYTPEVEEFHVGFEYYVSLDKKTFYHYFAPQDIFCRVDLLKKYIKDNSYQVKYLDREDIESLGFTFKTEDNKTDLFINFKLNISIIYNFETKVLRMITMDLTKSELYHEIQTDPHRIGGIIIKNKSEFKKLLTQLNLA